MAWDYSTAKFADNIDLRYLVRSIRLKWWSKFNIALIKKEKIDDWIKSFQHIAPAEKQGEKEAAFLAEK